jgi:hypothetical protein
MALVPFPQKAIKSGDPDPDWFDAERVSGEAGKIKKNVN